MFVLAILLHLVFIIQFCESNVNYSPCQVYDLYDEFPKGTSRREKRACRKELGRKHTHILNGHGGFVVDSCRIKKWDEDKDANGNYHILYGFSEVNHYTLREKEKKHVRETLKDYTIYTCLRFEEMPTRTHQSTNKIVITRNTTISSRFCSSQGLGRPPKANKARILNFPCTDLTNGKRTVLHEFMHSLGFAHEHTRYDRYKHIRITDDIELLKRYGGEFQYRRIKRGKMDVSKTPYDCNSIMHYPQSPVIHFIDRKCRANYDTFSEWDLYELNTQYICPSKMINQKVMMHSMSSYDYAVSKDHKPVIDAIENYVRGKFDSRRCYDSDIEKRILQKIYYGSYTYYSLRSCNGGQQTRVSRPYGIQETQTHPAPPRQPKIMPNVIETFSRPTVKPKVSYDCTGSVLKNGLYHISSSAKSCDLMPTKRDSWYCKENKISHPKQIFAIKRRRNYIYKTSSAYSQSKYLYHLTAKCAKCGRYGRTRYFPLKFTNYHRIGMGMAGTTERRVTSQVAYMRKSFYSNHGILTAGRLGPPYGSDILWDISVASSENGECKYYIGPSAKTNVRIGLNYDLAVLPRSKNSNDVLQKFSIDSVPIHDDYADMDFY